MHRASHPQHVHRANRHSAIPRTLALEQLFRYAHAMARPRTFSIDDLLDVAETIVTSGDAAGLTLRALSAASGASNGSIYHLFRSKEELLARAWLRSSERLGTVAQEAIVAAEIASGSGVETVVAVAEAPVEFANRYPASAQLFFAQRSAQVFSADLAPEIREAIDEDRARFIAKLRLLAKKMWDRTDGVAVAAITACVVDIPGSLVQRSLTAGREVDSATVARIDAAVRAVLALPLAPPRNTPKTRTEES